MGRLDIGQTSLQRLEALRDLGHEVVAIENCPDDRRNQFLFFVFRLRLKLYRLGIDAMTVRDVNGVERALLDHLDEAFDVLWMDKNWVVGNAAVESFRSKNPRAVIVGYSPDEMTGRIYHSRQFLDTLTQYDIFFTTKSYAVSELQALGCRRVEFVANSYDENIHKPYAPSVEDRQAFGGRVGFIGLYEPERANSIRKLGNLGIPVRVWGHSWHRFKDVPTSVRLERRPVWSSDYARAISSFEVNLAFLSKQNRDQQTTRSVEIPACGGFMLAERTEEHLALFEEGIEAEYFSSDEELVDKVVFYLAHDGLRRNIALAGRERCLRSGYGNRERLRRMMNVVAHRADNMSSRD